MWQFNFTRLITAWPRHAFMFLHLCRFFSAKDIVPLCCYSLGTFLPILLYLISSAVSQIRRADPASLGSHNICTHLCMITLPSNWCFICPYLSRPVTHTGKLFIILCVPNRQSPSSCSLSVWWMKKWFLLPGFQMLWDYVSQSNHKFWGVLFCFVLFKYLPLWLD